MGLSAPLSANPNEASRTRTSWRGPLVWCGADLAGIIAANAPFILLPDLVILLEIPVEMALARIHASRGEAETVFGQRSNLEAVAAIYGSFQDEVIFRVDGTGDPQEIHRLIVERICPER